MVLKFYTSVAKGLQLKVRKFWGLITTSVGVTRKKLVGGVFLALPILNRVRANPTKWSNTLLNNSSMSIVRNVPKLSLGFSSSRQSSPTLLVNLAK